MRRRGILGSNQSQEECYMEYYHNPGKALEIENAVVNTNDKARILAFSMNLFILSSF